jgi:class 3 adenylate cyclase/tetratricopeptide (TPR) repeat protein
MPVRKTVSVLFADVAGSTALGESLDAEAVRQVMARWFEEARAAVERHGGTVEKFAGDAVMAVFGLPAMHEDDALRAVRAAEELRDGVEEVELRIGVNTGEVVAGEGELAVTGDAVNVAARLEQTAEPGEILLGDATYRLVAAAVDVERLEPLVLRGKAEPVAAYRLLAVKPGAEPFIRRLDLPLVGRRNELAALRREFERARAGETCRLVTVIGEAGIGKSRLSRELVAEVKSEATVLEGRCLPYGEGITYWPLVEMLRDAAHHELRARLVALLSGESDAELIASRVSTAIGAGDGPPTTTDEIAWSVRRLFERLARERPLVVLVDDVQWAETAFLDLLEHVAYLARAPILLLLLARPEFGRERPEWPGTRVLLGALGEDESASLMRALGGTDERVVVTAQGNPLFLEQLLLLDGNGNGRNGGTLPPTIQALLGARLDRLETSERNVIEAASVVGQRFWGGAVSTLAPNVVPVAPALLGLIRQELIRPHDESVFPGEDTYAFVHLLVRDAAYATISKERRALLHEQLAEWLEQRDRERKVEHDEIVGYHLEQAVRLRKEVGLAPDERLTAAAAERLAAAGGRAFAREDQGAAATLLERAIRLLPESPARRDLQLKLGFAYWNRAEVEAAKALLDETAAAAEKAGDARRRELARMIRLEIALHEGELSTLEVRKAAERAIEFFEDSGDDLGLGRAWALYGWTWWMANRGGEAERSFRRSFEHAARAGDRQQETESLVSLSMALPLGPTPVDESVRQLEELLTQAHGARAVEASVLRSLGKLSAMRGDFDLARSQLERGIAIIEELGQRMPVLAAGGQARALVEILAGDSEAAARALRESCDELGALGETSFRSTGAGLLAEVLYGLDRLDEAEESARLAQELAAPDDLSSHALSEAVRAKVLARRGEHEEALRLAQHAVDLLAESDFFQARAATLAALAEVLFRAGRREEAERRFAEALAIVKAKGNVVERRLLEQSRAELVARSSL